MSSETQTATDSGAGKGILFVSHEATRTGAPILLLRFLRWLRSNTGQGFAIALIQGGPLESEFRALAPVYSIAELQRDPGVLSRFGLIYANTCCCGAALELLAWDRIPVVTHFHELDLCYDWLRPRQMAMVLRQSTGFVACAQAVARRMTERFGVGASNVHVAYGMIPLPDHPSVALRAAALRVRLGLAPETFVVMAAGTLEIRKGPDVLLQVAARLKVMLQPVRPVKVLWIGRIKEPDSEYMAVVRQDCRRHGLVDDVVFAGEQSDPEAWISLADAFCLTSREDPFPLVMLEAAALRKALVCFDGAGGAVEFCRLGGGIAVPYLDVEAMATECARLARDPERTGEIGARAEEIVRDRFVVESSAPALWRWIQGYMAANPVRPLARSNAFADVFRTWDLSQTNQRIYVEGHLQREATRQHARELQATGQRVEAVKALFKAVLDAVETQDKELILETMLEVSADLEPLDSDKARYLALEAEKLARASGVVAESRRVTRRPHPAEPVPTLTEPSLSLP